MGKKSKKGVSRAGTKKHNAAGHGKASATAMTSTNGRVRSDSKSSFESSNSVVNMNDNISAALAPTTMIHINEQPQLSSTNVESNSKLTDDVSALNNKENTATIPLISTQTLVSDVEKISVLASVLDQPTDPKEENSTETTAPLESVRVEEPPSKVEVVVVVTNEENITPLKSKESTESMSKDIIADVHQSPVVVQPVVVRAEVEQPPPPADIIEDPFQEILENVSERVHQVETLKESTVVTQENPVVVVKPMDQVDVWSSKLRDVVSMVDVDDPAAGVAMNKPVMDVTPVKQPRLVPLIQTVSPSPDQSQHTRPPIPLDRPDTNDAEAAKQNECGCIIV
jgi:hypothetical protein